MLETMQAISPLSPQATQALQSVIHSSAYKNNAHLLKIGQVAHHIYFVKKGIGRVFYHFNGLDVTDYFAIEGHFLGGVESLFTHQPSKKGVQVLEDSIVEYISHAQFENLCTQYHDIERLGRRLAIFGFLEGQERVESIRFKEAKERYIELNNRYPGLVNRCPLKHIASYLGITQVSLSRIRAEVQ